MKTPVKIVLPLLTVCFLACHSAMSFTGNTGYNYPHHVCGKNGVTYSECEARCRNIPIAHYGPCSIGWIGGGWDSTGGTGNGGIGSGGIDSGWIATGHPNWHPSTGGPGCNCHVCGENRVTYTECEAKCKNIPIAHYGPCSTGGIGTAWIDSGWFATGYPNWHPSTGGPGYNRHVCGENGVTYNECEAKCRSIRIAHDGPCNTGGGGGDWTGSDGTGHDGTGHDGTGHDGTGHDGTGRDGWMGTGRLIRR